MFSRISRIIKSFFNKFLSKAEDPVMILENNIREMKNKIPKLNEGVAKAQGKVIMLEKKLKNHIEDENSERNKLKVAAQTGQDDLGQTVALQLQRTIKQKEQTKLDLDSAKKALEEMKKMRDSQVMKIQQETEKIKDVIEDSKTAKLKNELSELFQTYKADDVAFSNDEMIEKLEEQNAMSEGKFASASSTPEMRQMELEMKSDQLQAQSLYEQFKTEMNVDKSESDSESDSKSDSKSKNKNKKTIG